MATASSLRAELSSRVVNSLMIGAASSAMVAGLLAVALGPLGLIALIIAPLDIGFALLIDRQRKAAKARAHGLGAAAGRGVAIVRSARPATGSPRGGQSPHAIAVEIRPASGRPFDGEALVWWTDAAAPGAWGVAAYDPAHPHDLLVYFARGPETPAELEAALNRETGQYRREPVLPDEPPTG
jgi:hypothetical protein